MQRATNAVLLIVAAVMLSVASCSDDNPTIPANETSPTFENIWPAEVGNHWVYDLDNRMTWSQGNLYQTPDEVPDVPTMEELYADLQAKVGVDSVSSQRGTFHLRFAEDVSPDQDTKIMRMDNHTDDLVGQPYPTSPLWLGQFWVNSGERISYSVGGFVGWVHLDGDLSPGHQFTVNIPGLVEARLVSRIQKSMTWIAMDTTYRDCLESFFVLDSGIRPVMNENNEIRGYYRPYQYGIIVYAPELGPVYCHEKVMMAPGQWDDRTATLASFNNDEE